MNKRLMLLIVSLFISVGSWAVPPATLNETTKIDKQVQSAVTKEGSKKQKTKKRLDNLCSCPSL